jgi:myosin V
MPPNQHHHHGRRRRLGEAAASTSSISSPAGLKLHMATSSSGRPEYVWVSIDLIEASLSSSSSSARQLKVRPRQRGGADQWGWCRALVNARDTTMTGAGKTVRNGSTAAGRNHHTSTSSRIGAPPPHVASWRGSPEKEASTVSIAITVDDEIFASPDLNGLSLTVTYDTNDDVVFQANTWWTGGDAPPAAAHQGGGGDQAGASAATESALLSSSSSPSDLTSLEQLHEPAVVFCLQRRYEEDIIYTYTGKTLLALNPFRPLDLYGGEVMRRYWGSGTTHDASLSSSSTGSTSRRPEPHIFVIAENAYRSAIESIRGNSQAEDQSILVSGESGAGKTVTTKIILQYFAVLSQQADPSIAGIESKVLESNPILESFGNARTIRNDNSSRFGKFMEMRFDSRGCLLSASIQTYLLEKVRLISQGIGERNYHVFYEILAGLTASERRDLRLSNRSARDFKMTSISETFDRRDGVHDRETYMELRTALDTVGFTAQEQLDLFTVVCGLLYTSNLTFVQETEDASFLNEHNASLGSAVDLLGVDYEVLNAALCTCAIEAGGETLYKQLSIYRAEKALEALIKTTYNALFLHIVKKINSFIAVRENAQRDVMSKQPASIGVLDIFGFESFERNSFEQLCINYCNEALQQQFNRFVFKLEQEEYKNEGIDWSFISFPDNQDVLDLIEKRHDGILAILDEQCRLPRCTDASFASAVYQKCKKSSRLVVTKAMEACSSFAIHHFAGLVEYDTDSFLEKNKDELPKETTLLLKSSAFPFLARLGLELTSSETPTTGGSPSLHQKGRQPRHLQRVASSIMHETVGLQFCNQLKLLRSRIEATSPHYVRCLKPNDELLPHSFNALVIADQLRCAGVLEAIRVSRVGFPHRYGHSQFVYRYGLLQNAAIARQKKLGANARDVCHDLIEHLSRQIIDSNPDNFAHNEE